MTLDPRHPLGPDFLAAVQASLDGFFATQADLAPLVDARLDEVWDQARHFAEGGKRVRPGFCYWAYVGATGEEPPRPVIDVAASLDLLHMSALVHDDLIDASDLRRGAPAAHRLFEAYHRSQSWQGEPEQFGAAAAILLGDLLFTWSVTMAEQAGLAPDRMAQARPYLHAVRTEVLAGQYLDLFQQGQPLNPETVMAEAHLVMDYKTAKYTVARPAQIGAALGLADDQAHRGLGAFGTHIGYAYQMRDDLLGVFADPALTGKPSGDDLRAGKKTVLVAYGLQQATPTQAAQLIKLLGNPELSEQDIAEARTILEDCGARASTETAIAAETTAGVACLEQLGLSEEGTEALSTLAYQVAERET